MKLFSLLFASLMAVALAKAKEDPKECEGMSGGKRGSVTQMLHFLT
jgi:hypothetical protein